MISLEKFSKNDEVKSIYLENQSIFPQCTSRKCLKSPFQRNLKQTTTERLLRPLCGNKSSIYFTKDTQASPQSNKVMHYPSIMSLPSNRIIFKSSAGVSLKETNISFTYTSPPKSGRYHSTGARFSTKKFKEQHFPLLGQGEDNGSPVKRIVRSKQRDEKVIYAREKTPDKHKILKIKKQKQKLMSSQRQNKQNNKKQASFALNQYYKKNYEADCPRKTPIYDMWLNESQKTQNQLNSEYMLKDLNKKNPPTSIEFIKISERIPSKRQVKATIVTPTFEKILQTPPVQLSNKKYPTLQSIDVYEAIKHTNNNGQHAKKDTSRCQLTSLRLMLQQNVKKSTLNQVQGSAEDIFLAKSISEELQLHYDYCFALEESDRSLSIHVTF